MKVTSGTRKGRRGGGASGKVGCIRLAQAGREGFHCELCPTQGRRLCCRSSTKKVTPDSIGYTNSFKAYNALDVSDFHHMLINHTEFFADRRNHINGIENFWNQAKRHLRKFNGIDRDSFHWFLKEGEWCFNGGNHQSLYKQFKQWYLKKISLSKDNP
jgi:transposase